MKKALVVDDSRVTRSVISRMLARYGYSVIEAADGQEAVTRLKDNPEIEIAFVDWCMPVMTGIEFLARVRQDREASNYKIVMVTNCNEKEDVVTALSHGADEYIMLPLTKEVLQDKLALLDIFPEEGAL